MAVSAIVQEGRIYGQPVNPSQSDPVTRPLPSVVVESTREQKIRKLFAISRGEVVMTNLLTQTIAQLKEATPQVPAEFWSQFERELKYADPVDLSVPIYAKHLTDEDLDGLARFYESELGQKAIQVMPQIVQEISSAANRRGMDLEQ